METEPEIELQKLVHFKKSESSHSEENDSNDRRKREEEMLEEERKKSESPPATEEPMDFEKEEKADKKRRALQFVMELANWSVFIIGSIVAVMLLCSTLMLLAAYQYPDFPVVEGTVIESHDCVAQCTKSSCIYNGTIKVSYYWNGEWFEKNTDPSTSACGPDCCQQIITSQTQIYLQFNGNPSTASEENIVGVSKYDPGTGRLMAGIAIALLIWAMVFGLTFIMTKPSMKRFLIFCLVNGTIVAGLGIILFTSAQKDSLLWEVEGYLCGESECKKYGCNEWGCNYYGSVNVCFIWKSVEWIERVDSPEYACAYDPCCLDHARNGKPIYAVIEENADETPMIMSFLDTPTYLDGPYYLWGCILFVFSSAHFLLCLLALLVWFSEIA